MKQRQSIAYFCNVNGDTMIETIESCCTEDPDPNQETSTTTKKTLKNKYEPITAMEHLMSKHLEKQVSQIKIYKFSTMSQL